MTVLAVFDLWHPPHLPPPTVIEPRVHSGIGPPYEYKRLDRKDAVDKQLDDE